MAPVDEMGFKFIQQIQQKESRSHNLTKLPADFFQALTEHIARLRQLAREETARDPMSTTATLVQNELKNTIRLANDIVNLRLRKMANRAVDSLEGGKVDIRSLTPRERDLYGQLATFMSEARDHMAPGDASTRAPAPLPSPIVQPDQVPEPQFPAERDTGDKGGDVGDGKAPEGRPADAGGQGPAPVASEEPRLLIHVLKDTPPFAGEGGRTHTLKRGDMVTLSQKLAEVLISRGMAEEVEPGTTG
jgi:DNA replication factor GINS